MLHEQLKRRFLRLMVLTTLYLILSLSASSPGQAQSFAGRLMLTQAGNIWNYTLFNDEPSGSLELGGGIFLPIAAPVMNIMAPAGWVFLTDDTTFIQWLNIENAPYPNAIAPGGALSGFQFGSVTSGGEVTYLLTPFDATTGVLLPEVSGKVLAPSMGAAVPEPHVTHIAAIVCVIGVVLLLGRRRALTQRAAISTRRAKSVNKNSRRCCSN